MNLELCAFLCFSLVESTCVQCVCTSLSEQREIYTCTSYSTRENHTIMIKCVKLLKRCIALYRCHIHAVMTQKTFICRTIDIGHFPSYFVFLFIDVVPCDVRFVDLFTPLYIKCLKIQKCKKNNYKSFPRFFDFAWGIF